MLDVSEYPFWNELMEGIVRSQYELLTGAGFSRDVRDRSGSRLPTGDGLRDELIEAFGLPKSSDPRAQPSLTQVYALCQNRGRSKDGRTVNDWLEKRFSKTRYPQWFTLLKDLSFNNIWTLNIDDALERALEGKSRSFHYLDRTTTLESALTPIVYLHGMAKRPERGLVFALDEYAGRIREPRPFAERFQESLPGSPFVIVGASLSSEVDIATSLKARFPIAGQYPSVIVRPHFDDFSRMEVEHWGFEPIEATAEEFFRAVHESHRETAHRLAPILAEENHRSPLNSRFTEQWISPNAYRAPRGQNFLTGDEPFYTDVASGQMIARETESSIVSEISKGSGRVLLRGALYAGKTAISLRVAGQFSSAGWNVFLYRGGDGIDVEACLAAIRNHANTLLIVDDAGLFASSIVSLVENAVERGVALHLLCVDRDGPATRLRRHDQFKQIICRVRLTEAEIKDYLDKLSSRDLLNEKWRNSSFRIPDEVGDDFVSIISECVVGQNFENRIIKDALAVNDGSKQAILLLACMFSRVSKGVDLALIAATFGSEVQDFIRDVEDSKYLSSLVRIDRGAIRPRHHRLAETIIRSGVLSRKSMGSVITFTKVLASRVDPGAISANTRFYRMAARLLDHENLAQMVGKGNVESVYEAVEAEYTWNSRYWEQRALAASSRMAHEDAIRWAGTALNVHEDAYTLNTSATVHFKFMASDSIVEDSIARVAERALADVREARAEGREDSEYPYVTFFSYAPRLRGLARRNLLHQITEVELEAEWRNWYTAAQSGKAFNYPEGATKLEKFDAEWKAGM